MSYDRKVEPTQITQGEQIAWTKTYDDFPASLWTLEYRFRGNGTGFNVAATADGPDFDAVVTKAASASTTAGRYYWQAWLTEIADSNNVNMIADGRVDFLQGFDSATTTAIDLRTNAKKTLDAIDAALLAFATSDIVEYEISTPAGRNRVVRSDKVQLMKDRQYWAIIVANEKVRDRLRNGGPLGRQVKVRISDNG